jgi:hypothetical protein
MPAHITYEIHGVTSSKVAVSVLVKALTTPTPEAALWLIREKYPSVSEDSVKVSLPAAHRYPTRPGPVRVRNMESTTIRRTR